MRRLFIVKIGFLFNHDQIHQVAHSLPIALALAERRRDVDVTLAVTNPAILDEIRRLGGARLTRPNLQLHLLDVRGMVTRAVVRATGRWAPSARFLVYRDNLAFFRALDALVVSEKTSLVLKRRYGLGRLKLIHTRHGAGDRAIGFNKASAGFDLVLVSGQKIADRLIRDVAVPPGRISVVGYPKFDLVSPGPGPFDRSDPRPIVLYNPHLSPRLSSWYKMGLRVLDWFADHPEYRLIFAPHIMLFHRPVTFSIDPPGVRWPGAIPRRIRAARNIFIDTGSPASVDMTYTRAADIYLGDVSSQVYEFMIDPRPCVFLDPRGIDWYDDPSFAHWRAGPVLMEVEGLDRALRAAQAEHRSHFRAVQQELLDRTFDMRGTPASERAAAAIHDFLIRREAPLASATAIVPHRRHSFARAL